MEEEDKDTGIKPPKDPSGFIAERMFNTPKERMGELTLLPRTITMQLASLTMEEKQWLDIIGFQESLANEGLDEKSNDLFKADVELPSETLKYSLFGFNRSIDGEHLEHGRELIGEEIASKEIESEENRPQ